MMCETSVPRKEEEEALLGRSSNTSMMASTDLSLMTWHHRTNELRRLHVALKRSISPTNPVVSSVFISGASGSGKTFLLDAFAKSIADDVNKKDTDDDAVLVCRGKFDNIDTSAAEPMAAILSVLETLVSCLIRQIAKAAAATTHQHQSQGQAQAQKRLLEEWRERIKTALGEHEMNHMQERVPALRQLMTNDRRRSSFAMSGHGHAHHYNSFDEPNGNGGSGDDDNGYIGTERDWGFERFRLACRSLIHVISRHYAVVIYLDDLQWAERDSFEILRTWLRECGCPGWRLLFVATHEEQHSSTKPGGGGKQQQTKSSLLRQLLESKTIRSNFLTRLALSQFRAQDVGELLMSHLLQGGSGSEPKHYSGSDDNEKKQDDNDDELQVLPLVDFCFGMTQGNALMMAHLFRYLHDKGMFRYNPDTKRIVWDKELLDLPELVSVEDENEDGDNGDDNDSFSHRPLTVQLDCLNKDQKLLVTSIAFLGNSTFDVSTLAQVLVPNEDDEDVPNQHCLPGLFGKPLGQRIKLLQPMLQALVEQGLVEPCPMDAWNGSGGGTTSASTSSAAAAVAAAKVAAIMEDDSGTNAATMATTPKPTITTTRFAMHDLVRNVAYQHLGPKTNGERKELHLLLGRRLNALMQSSAENGTFVEEALLFNTVNQMNQACGDLIQDEWELIEVVDMNYHASEVSALKHSYFSALKYLSKGIDLLGPDPWKHHFQVMKKLSNAQSRMQLYCGQTDESLQLAEQIIEHAKCFADKKLAYRTKLMCLLKKQQHQQQPPQRPSSRSNSGSSGSNAKQQRQQQQVPQQQQAAEPTNPAFEFNLAILQEEKELDQVFPRGKDVRVEVTRTISRTKRLLRGRSDQDLLTLLLGPKDQDNNNKNHSKSATTSSSASSLNDVGDFMISLGDMVDSSNAGGIGVMNDYMVLAMLRLLQMTLAQGQATPATPLCFVSWGYLMAQAGEYTDAIRFGQLGLKMAQHKHQQHHQQQQQHEHHQPKQHVETGECIGWGRYDVRAKIMYHRYIDHWNRPLNECRGPFAMAAMREEAVERGLFDSLSVLEMAFVSGRPLDELSQRAQQLSELFNDFKWHVPSHKSSAPFFQMIANLSGSADGVEQPTALDGIHMHEQDQVAKWKASGNDSALQMYYLCVATLALFFCDYTLADEMCNLLWLEGSGSGGGASSSSSGSFATMAAATENGDASGCFGPDFWTPYRVFLRGCVGFVLGRLNRSRKHKKQGEMALKQFNRWIQHQDGVANCAHFRLILQALKTATNATPSSSSTDELRTAFDDAIDQCFRNGFLQFSALANELAGSLFVERNDDLHAKLYLSKARVWYREWNCHGKIRQMHSLYIGTLDPQSEAFTPPTGSGCSPTDAPPPPAFRWNASAKI